MDKLTNQILINCIEKARQSGFKTEFLFSEGHLVDRKSLRVYGKEDCFLVSYERFQSMSDPSESSILFVIECIDGNKGYLSSALGVNADANLFDFVKSIKPVGTNVHLT